MLYWLMQQKWLLLRYPVEIVVNALLIWAILNRMAPPRMVIEDPQGGDEWNRPKATLRRIRQFPIGKCLICSVLLFVVFAVAMTPLFALTLLGTVAAPSIPLFLGFWFFGSRWAVSLVFEGQPGQHAAIFLVYTFISVGVEVAIKWGARLFGLA